IICHQLNTKNNIISGSEVSRLSVAIQSFFAAQGKSNWHRYEHCAATARREGKDVRHHYSPSE
ncbi:hypothetical protein RAF42_12420, partial [Klebsiella pneumoniae]